MIIIAVGDTHVNRPEPLTAFQYVSPLLRQADITLGNLEAPICDQGQPIMGKLEIGSVHVRSSVLQTAEGLHAAGYTAVGFSSNHSMDYGAEGLLQCIHLLDKAKVGHAGSGRNLAEAHKPAIIKRDGNVVALLAYNSIYLHAGFAAKEDKPGIATLKVHTSYQAPDNILYQPGFPAITITIPDPLEIERMLEDVREAKKVADIVVTSFHWGVSWGYGRVVGYQKEVGRAAIDAGADLVMGHHPHRLLGMEMYKGKLICYSLGNFVLDGLTMPHFGKETLILKAYVHDKQIKRFTFIPALINDGYQPQPLTPKEGAGIVKMMENMSEEFGTDFNFEGNEVIISGPRPGTPPPERGMSVLRDSLLTLPYVKGVMAYMKGSL